jgi:hypothetical protein
VIGTDDAMRMVENGSYVTVSNADDIVAEGEVVAFSRTPHVLIRADDGSTSWWPITLDFEEQS